MPERDLYLGPDFNWTPPSTEPQGTYTVADQARGFGIPEEQLTEEAPATPTRQTETN